MNLTDLLTKGYFPEELPPPFTTIDLARAENDLLNILNAVDPIGGKKTVTTKMTSFTIPKIKAYRRSLGIPHPMHFLRLSKTIVDNWADIIVHCDNTDISLSPLKIKAGSARALLKPSFNHTTREKILRSTGKRYLLKVDIAKFYSSIYTHSIPWALHTKGIAKGQRDRTILYGNGLDEDARKMQDGQTVGLPIGPETSRIISEVILAAIDREIKGQIGYLEGVRVVDDYHLYFKTHGDLEQARAAISRVLKDYELELNQSKEQLLELPEIIEREWFAVIREFKFRAKWNYQRTDLITYFDTIVSFSKKYPEDNVLTYAMSKLRFTVFGKKNWAVLQSLLLNVLSIEPKVLPYVAQTLIGYHQQGYALRPKVVRSFLEEFIIYHCSLGNDFEIAWALWLAKSLKIMLSEGISDLISKNMNPIVVLTALDVQDKKLFDKKLDLTTWRALLNTTNLSTENWLIAYEVKKRRWIKNPTNYLPKHPFFSILLNHDVSFYHDDRTLDLSKLKLSTAPQYFGEDDDDSEENEPESVFNSVAPPPPHPLPLVIGGAADDDVDLPF